MVWIYLLLALAAGTALPVQAGVNASLAKWTGHTALAALISFGVGSVMLLAYALALRPALPAASHLAQAPWWAWIGGLFGAYFIWTAIVATGRIGPALFFGLVVTGQLVASAVIEHFGWFGIARHPISLPRIGGALLLLGGLALMRMK